MVLDDLTTVLRSVKSLGAVFDTEAPPNFTYGPSPAVSVMDISSIPEQGIDQAIAGSVERWQVSVRASTAAGVRAGRTAVIDALHGYLSESIASCSYESSGPLVQESESPTVFASSVDFMIEVSGG